MPECLPWMPSYHSDGGKHRCAHGCMKQCGKRELDSTGMLWPALQTATQAKAEESSPGAGGASLDQGLCSPQSLSKASKD